MKRTTTLITGCRLVFACLLALFAPLASQAQCLVDDAFNDGVLSAPWVSLDINTAGTGSSAEGSALTITSIDNGIVNGSATDSFRYTYLSTSGDPEVMLRIPCRPRSGHAWGSCFVRGRRQAVSTPLSELS
jgi:hypothetical protein